MNRKPFAVTIIAFFLFTVLIVPQIVSCQTDATLEPTATAAPQQGGVDLLLIVAIAVAVVVVAVLAAFFVLKKRRVNEKSLRKSLKPRL